ncbi:E3 ubiquitin-protein ligase TRIM39-like [Mastacembelus armatus]|uniref:E3 ubiquitin-protein ligase TRIM39-like n=1 Tax=Mastacembelus armatus TaxID=205130 RepID=A0A7N8XAY3_9TELE|nr:E3 ubiquitin-protein ligase TRIM39-like [Mastacembelus armatus]
MVHTVQFLHSQTRRDIRAELSIQADMASASSLLSEDQFLCSICLDVFSKPVSIPCGHNFCKACISRHWQDKEECQCPLCNEKFNKKPKLCVNTTFRDVVENFKKLRVVAKNDLLVKPGQVPCDHCLGTKFKASKTCLVCLTSYCEIHLEPHRQVATLKEHKLIDPVLNLEKKICKKHNRMLELYCRNDCTRVCILCTEHRTHHTVPLEEEYEEKKVQLEKKKLEAQKMIQERQKKVQEINEIMQFKRKDKDEAVENSLLVFNNLVISTQSQLAKLLNVIEEKQKAAERQAEVLVIELEKEISALQRRVHKLECNSHIEDHLQFIKSFLSCSSSSPQTKNWSDISISGQLYVEDLRRAVVELEETLTKETERASQEFRVCCSKIIAEETIQKKAQPVTDLETLPEGVKLDTIRQQYTVDMTFDPHTANDLLLFSADSKSVRTSHLWWFENEGMHRFNRYAYVLGKKGFSEGRFYYEVQAARKTGWDLGVVRESIRGSKTLTPNPRSGAWIIRLRNNTELKALNNTPVKLAFTKKPVRIGVFVDYEKGLVSFYDVDAATLIYSFTDCLFNERIYPFFSPGPSEEGVNGAPLLLSPATESTVWKQLKDFLVLIFTVIALVLILQNE